MAEEYYLHRTWYQTDAAPEGDTSSERYLGAFSGTIPGRIFRSGWQIVGVNWSNPGEVEVTYLVPGRGPTAISER